MARSPSKTPVLEPEWGTEKLRFDPSELVRRVSKSRPTPPESVGEDVPERFVADAAFADWVRVTFIAEGGALVNERHDHLNQATIGVLWTNAINKKQMRLILGQAELPKPTDPWKGGRSAQQMTEWFGHVPDFILTFYAPDVRQLEDRMFCALVEHELCHCAQDIDKYGVPKFGRMGEPLFAMRGHDVEEFVEVVERYGATSDALLRMIAAANAGPEMADDPISIACGNCAKAAA